MAMIECKKLALLGLVRDYRREQEIAADLVDLAKTSLDLSKFVSDQLEVLLISSPRTALRLTAKSAIKSLNEGNSLPLLADEQRKFVLPVFIVAADESQRMQSENDGVLLSGLAEKVKRFTGEEPKLVDDTTHGDPGMYEIWLSKR